MVAAISLSTLTLRIDDVLPLLAYWWMAAVGIVLGVVDLAVHRLPDRLTALLAVGAGAALTAQTVITHDAGRLTEALASGFGAAFLYLSAALLTAGGIGIGDAKLAFSLGLTVGWTGWPAVLFATALALMLTGITAVALLALKRAYCRDAIPHGPFMVFAAAATIGLAAT
ncbi:prepilin peptidase [Plantactinospora sp. CA-290183]|uniref:prepilin peptidase n=1 Tax=Plantactinospora sp. CA-290183 TaxID=3240006 RepID=UPI003D948FB1